MDATKLYLCFEATSTKEDYAYLIFSAKVSDLLANARGFRPKFTLEKIISGVSSMGCGLFDSKIVLAGGVSVKGEKTEYNRDLVTYDTVSKKVAREDIPSMRGRKVRPLVFELNERLYVLDTSNSVYKRTCEVYYPTVKIWAQISDPFCTRYNARSGIKNVSGRTPYSWFVAGKAVFISSPADGFTYFHHATQGPRRFSIDDNKALPFQGVATAYWKPGFSDVFVISFSQGQKGGQGRVDGRRWRYYPFCFTKPEVIFRTDPYEKPDGEVSSYFADCGEGKFCLTTFDNVNIRVYVFKIAGHEGDDGSTSLVLKDVEKHRYEFTDFSSGSFTSVSLSGCFVLPRPRDEGNKQSEESNLYHHYFSCYETEVKDEDLPLLVETDKGLKIHPDYDSGGADSEIEL